MTTLAITNHNVYPLAPVPLTHTAWKYVDGARVRPSHRLNDEPWVVLKRLSIAPFPHYEVMDDQGHLWVVPQLALVTA